MLKIYKIVVRFASAPDYEISFHSDVEAYSYFEHLVKFELDGLLTGVWSISLRYGKKGLRHYNNYLNVKR